MNKDKRSMANAKRSPVVYRIIKKAKLVNEVERDLFNRNGDELLSGTLICDPSKQSIKDNVGSSYFFFFSLLSLV